MAVQHTDALYQGGHCVQAPQMSGKVPNHGESRGIVPLPANTQNPVQPQLATNPTQM